MFNYLVKYQFRRKANVSMSTGEWQDGETVVLAKRDARVAIDEIISMRYEYDVRISEVVIIGEIDIVSKCISEV